MTMTDDHTKTRLFVCKVKGPRVARVRGSSPKSSHESRGSSPNSEKVTSRDLSPSRKSRVNSPENNEYLCEWITSRNSATRVCIHYITSESLQFSAAGLLQVTLKPLFVVQRHLSTIYAFSARTVEKADKTN